MASRATPDLIWSLIRGYNSFLVSQPNARFTRERGNLLNKHNRRFSGLTHARTADVHTTKKGLVLTLKKTASAQKQKPATQRVNVQLHKCGWRKYSHVLASEVSKYRPDLRRAAMRRAKKLHRASYRPTVYRLKKEHVPKPKLTEEEKKAAKTAKAAKPKAEKVTPKEQTEEQKKKIAWALKSKAIRKSHQPKTVKPRKHRYAAMSKKLRAAKQAARSAKFAKEHPEEAKKKAEKEAALLAKKKEKTAKQTKVAAERKAKRDARTATLRAEALKTLHEQQAKKKAAKEATKKAAEATKEATKEAAKKQ
eukprot:TRINITY_DN18475_c0_g1_i1.p1 TRINITY_DN18475_c0_g1~~TRINITY_DN18475_c0_g1_i1.p1  ORF type:complete len:323 (+),score=114.70 TRINITY_DN18475_c0_g1_i1:46-969(+)